jgi:hypothetical protein
MKKLEDISLGNRIAITVIIVLAILFALALIGYLTGGWEAEAQTESRRLGLQPLPISKFEKRLLELDRDAADQAYREQIMHLFQTWMRDEREQPLRATTGARQARSAYERVINAIEERERLVKDNPP